MFFKIFLRFFFAGQLKKVALCLQLNHCAAPLKAQVFSCIISLASMIQRVNCATGSVLVRLDCGSRNSESSELTVCVWCLSSPSRFCLINAGVLYLYFSNYLQIDEEEYGGTWELTKEGFMTSFALFMVCVADR